MEENEQPKIEDLQEFEAEAGIELSEFEGQKTKLDKAEIIEVTTSYNPETGKEDKGKEYKAKRLKIVSEVVTKHTNKDGKEIEIRASELFGLKFVEGVWGVSTSPKSHLNKLLKKLKLPDGLEGVKQIGGQEVTLKIVVGKDDNEFLGFIY